MLEKDVVRTNRQLEPKTFQIESIITLFLSSSSQYQRCLTISSQWNSEFLTFKLFGIKASIFLEPVFPREFHTQTVITFSFILPQLLSKLIFNLTILIIL
jgi:hypothetical protein